MKLKRILRGGMALILASSVIASTPGVALAAEKAASLEEIATIIRTKCLESHDAKFEINCSLDYDEVYDRVIDDDKSDVIDGMVSMMDDPSTTKDADYIVGNLAWEGSEMSVETDRSGKPVLSFNIHLYETAAQTQYVDEHAPQILAEIGMDGKTTYEKVRAVYEWVCKRIVYKKSNKDTDSSVYGAIYEGKGICNAYALCLYRLLVEAGIPCKYIGGKAGTGRDAGGHAWNIVAVGDKWYNCDPTWDDSEYGEIGYEYFLKGSRDFDEEDPSQPHKRDYGYTTFFEKAFPVAESAFNPTMMSDENTTVKIGSNLGDVASTTPGTDPQLDPEYSLKDVVFTTEPESKKFTVKKNKRDYLLVALNDGMEEVVDSVSYSVSTGKSRIKSILNDGIQEEQGMYYAQISFKGKKKGKVSISVKLNLTNGQTISVNFSGTVK